VHTTPTLTSRLLTTRRRFGPSSISSGSLAAAAATLKLAHWRRVRAAIRESRTLTATLAKRTIILQQRGVLATFPAAVVALQIHQTPALEARSGKRCYKFCAFSVAATRKSGNPREIEDVIASHPDVAMCAVVGVPHAKWGEAVTALVVLHKARAMDGDTLIDLVKARKGSAWAPKQIHFVDTLPVTGLGKIDTKALRAEFWCGRGRQVG
jgi:hypothetical protein